MVVISMYLYQYEIIYIYINREENYKYIELTKKFRIGKTCFIRNS